MSAQSLREISGSVTDASGEPLIGVSVLVKETRAWADHNRYFPIPQNERNVNKNLEQFLIKTDDEGCHNKKGTLLFIKRQIFLYL